MSDTYTPDGSGGYQSPYTTPADSDADDAASFDVPIAQLADNVDYLADGAYDRWYHADLGAARYNQDSRFAEYYDEGGTGHFGWGQGSVASVGELIFPIHGIPPNAVITSIEVEIEGSGAGSTHSATPATMPHCDLATVDTGDSALQLQGFDATDATPYPSYDSAHTFSASSSLNTKAKSTYWAVFHGEAGANSIANALLLTRISVYVEKKVAS